MQAFLVPARFFARGPPDFSYVKRETRSKEDAERWCFGVSLRFFGFAKKGIWNAGRRRAVTSAPWLVRRCLPRDPQRVRAGEEAARLPAFHHGSSQGVLLSLGAIRARLRGRTRQKGRGYPADGHCHFQRRTSHAGRNAGGHDARTAREQVASLPAGSASRPAAAICLRDAVPYRAR